LDINQLLETITDSLRTDQDFILRLFVAMLLGGLVGLERQSRGRAAGLRTNILVCLGSAAIIVVFQKLSLDASVDAASAIRMDPARAASGVITGIGFLGAGTIVKSADFVRGLTTAASIWVVSAIGVTVGLGEYSIASCLTLLVLVTLFALHRIPLSSDHYASLDLRWNGDLGLLEEVLVMLLEGKVIVKQQRVTCHPKTGECHVVLNTKFGKKSKGISSFASLQSDQRFDRVSWT
jgi:putative Mg2+ transporter-C (MgtC) family protein